MLVIMLVVRFHKKSGSDDLSRKSGLLDRRFCLLEAEAKRVFFAEIEGCCCDEDKVSDEHVVVILEPEAERCLAVVDEVDVTPDCSMMVINSDKYFDSIVEAINLFRYLLCNKASTTNIASSKHEL